MSRAIVIAEFTKNRREMCRVALDNYQGVDLIDLRVTVQLSESSGIWTPTKKGLSLRVEQLPELIAALQEAHQRAIADGLIGGPA